MTTCMSQLRWVRCLARLASLALAFALLVPSATPASAIDLPRTRLRIRIADRGIYELEPADLAAAGVPVGDAGIDPRTLRLFFDRWKPVPLLADSTPSSWQRDYEMSEVALWVRGEEDGRLDPADRIVFYALGPGGWDDLAGAADSLAHSQHPYDRYDYGWMVWGGAPGRRMQARSVSAAQPISDPLVTRVWHREHREEDRLSVPIGDLFAWERVHPVNPTSVDFPLDLGTDSTATGTIRLQLGSLYYGSDPIEVRLNDVALGSVPTDYADRVERFAFDGVPLRAHNTLVLQSTGHSYAGTSLLFELEATWERPLVADTWAELAWSARPPTDSQVYELGGFGGAEPLLLDVTDRTQPVRLTDLTRVEASENWRVRDGRGAGRRIHYLAAATPRRLDLATDLALRQVAPLRSRTSSPDMLIVTHPDLLPAAERLAAHRRTHLPGVPNADVLVTTTEDIYENFSGGRQDPLAIRNWVKFLYELSPEPRLAYLLLIGDATRDPRQVLPQTPPTRVPAVHAPWADSRATRAYAVEDWMVAMHDPSRIPFPFVPQADLSIGRLPARDLSEAETMVDKIFTYEGEASFGAWRGRVLMVADDECQPAGCFEPGFVREAEELAAMIPAELDLTKIYLTEYPLVDYQKPAARTAFIQSWSEGCALVSYVGHGAQRQLADEVLFLANDVAALTNGDKLPIFMTIGCNVSEFDIPGYQSICELLVAAPQGGAIATIGATTTPYLGPASVLAEQQFAELFRAGIADQRPIGLVHRLAKRRPTTYDEHFVLLGDPALVLQLPKAIVTIDSGADALVTGRRARIEGVVHEPGSSDAWADFNGDAEVEVLGNGLNRHTAPVPVEVPYVLPGAPIYRGHVQVNAGRFAFEFTVPHFDPDSTNAMLTGAGGRVALYAWNTRIDAKGGRDRIAFTPGSVPDPSLAPPRIRLSFPGGAIRVTSDATLTAEIEDENGIWIADSTPGSSIRLQLDGSDPVDVTPAYRSSGGTDTSGSVSMQLPSLPPGPHRATVSAADNFGHPSAANLDFEVIASPITHLVDFRAAPNPTRAGTEFSFLLDLPADIELRVFSIAGREVFRTRGHHDGLRRGLVRWSGKSTDGRPVASGVYLYRLDVRGSGVTARQLTGKLAVVR